jgi:hypothetical protein
MHRLWFSVLVSALLATCGRGTAERDSVDTALVFVATPATGHDSGSEQSMHPVMAVLEAYSEKRITADAAAKLIVDHMMKGAQPINVEMDAPLRDAIAREMKRRRGL